MKKRFLSAMTAISLAASLMPAAVMAEGDTVLYSDSFNGYPTSARTEGGTVFAVSEASQDHINAGTFQWMIDSPQTRELDKLTVEVNGTGDDTATAMIKEKDAADKYLSLTKNRFPTRGIPKITGFENYTANTGEALVISFKAKLTAGIDYSSAEIMPSLSLGDLGTLGSDLISRTAWSQVKIVTVDGATSVYVDGRQVGSRVNNTVLSEIGPVPFSEATKCSEFATVDIDDIVIMSSPNGVNATIPAAEDQSFDEPETPEVTEAPTAELAVDPEPASEVEGSNIDLKPSSGRDFDSTDHSAVLGTPTKVLNHSEAKPAAEGKFSTYSDKVKGNSIFVTYDVYVGKGDKLTFAGYGDSGTALGPQFVIEGMADSTAVVSGIGNKGIVVAAKDKVLTETWYRVVLEVPQTSDGATGTSTYTVYRIDPADPSNTTETAASVSVTPRNLSGRGMTEMQVSITGTPYIDNLAAYFDASGSAEPTEAPQPTDTPQITPEPTAAVEGSNIDLKPSSGRDFDSDDYSAVLGTPTKVLNHSEAKPAAEGKFSTYSDKVKGNSIFVTYDVYVGKGDKLTFAGYGDSGTALGPQFVIEGMADSTAVVSGIGNKGDVVAAKDKVLTETWYRVVLEVPQTSDGATGTSTYTVYRIDPADPSNTTETAASVSVTPRNLSGRGMTEMQVSITGTPYIDNLAAYYIASGSSETPDPASIEKGIKLVYDAENSTDTKKVIKAYYVGYTGTYSGAISIELPDDVVEKYESREVTSDLGKMTASSDYAIKKNKRMNVMYTFNEAASTTDGLIFTATINLSAALTADWNVTLYANLTTFRGQDGVDVRLADGTLAYEGTTVYAGANSTPAPKMLVDGGICGDNALWDYYSDGELVISGDGDMYDYSGSDVPWYSYRTDISSVEISDDITSIGSYAFYECTGLTSISLPDGVTSIGGGAFSGCTGLTNISLPDGVTSIGDFAFSNCTGLTSISLPDGVTSISDYAFDYCTGLTSISLPDGVTSIGGGAFEGCTGLTSISLPEGVTSIGEYAFARP